MNKIEQVKQYVIEEFSKIEMNWFVESHLKVVEKYIKALINKIPESDEESLLLAVWLHDTGYLKSINSLTHEQDGADGAEKIMKKFDYNQEEINKVKNIVITHSCKKNIPKTQDQKILSTADAMSHFNKDFYLDIAVLGEKNKTEFITWAKNKLEKDYKDKIFFDEAREEIKPQYEIIKKFLEC